ncbi:Hypothetical predicted protein [Lecanosticta acicola]|uniref:Uncharacterized protein n=1 Tax=Lecanosticta acicola TaxID=111012 RepID=A0AAI8YSE3_9PEZI|nr:Hypothetical predicted protein [Lecanosticta acicola]
MSPRPGSLWFSPVLVLLTALALCTSPSFAHHPRGFSDYIRAGLGSAHNANSTVRFKNATGPDGNATHNLAACATSWASYSAQLSSHISNVTTTLTQYEAVSTTLVYGTGDVYTTKAGIPIASGSFTPTRSLPTVYNLTLEPCPEYYYQPSTTCNVISQHNAPDDCHIYGNSVRLFYFPTQTFNASIASPAPTAPPLVYSFAPGTTFTSPSVYLSFDYLSGQRLIQSNGNSYCTTCNQQGCQQMAVDGGLGIKKEGTTIPGQLITLAPGEVKSVVMDYSPSNASSTIDILAHGLPAYSSAMQAFFESSLAGQVAYKSLAFEDYRHPPPEAYYLQPTPASGCNFTTPDPQCSTVFEGQYRALISLPSEVTGLQGPWKSCTPVIYGVYDPPIALTEASFAAGITMPPGSAHSDNPNAPSPEQPAAAPSLPPGITVPKTAPGPVQTQGPTYIPPAESAVLPSAGNPSNPDSQASSNSDGSGLGVQGNGSPGESGQALHPPTPGPMQTPGPTDIPSAGSAALPSDGNPSNPDSHGSSNSDGSGSDVQGDGASGQSGQAPQLAYDTLGPKSWPPYAPYSTPAKKSGPMGGVPIWMGHLFTPS